MVSALAPGVTKSGQQDVTDVLSGYGQGNRPIPILPNQVYAFDPATNRSRVLADGFGRPNGLAANVDDSVVYIGDTGADIGNKTIDYQGPR